MQKCFFFLSVAGAITALLSLIVSSYAIDGLNEFIILTLKFILFTICVLGIMIHSAGFQSSLK